MLLPLALGLRFQRLDQGLELSVRWLDLRKLLGVGERCSVISRIAVEANERQKRVAIARMPGEIVLESLDCVAVAAARVERHGIDIDIARTVRLEFGGAGEL